MSGTKGRTGFHRLTAGRVKGNGMGGRKRSKLKRMSTRNRAGGR